jgi:hypothetical protein
MSTITDLKTNKTLYLQCSCRSEVLVIEYDHNANMADLIIYSTRSAFDSKLSFWQKLRRCYHILMNHKPYTDQMVLDANHLKELKSFIYGLGL